MQKSVLFSMFTGLLCIILVTGCLSGGLPGTGPAKETVDPGTNPWMEVPLRDVSTHETYTIGQLAGKPVLLYTFTTWCSICTAQQEEIKKLEQAAPGSFVSVGIDIDPYENETIVRNHRSASNFGGLYSVAPPELTRLLVDEYGVGIITPSSAPMLLICRNGSVTPLERGVKSAKALDGAIRARCP